MKITRLNGLTTCQRVEGDLIARLPDLSQVVFIEDRGMVGFIMCAENVTDDTLHGVKPFFHSPEDAIRIGMAYIRAGRDAMRDREAQELCAQEVSDG